MTPPNDGMSFFHVQLYVDHLEDLETYKTLERRLNSFSRKVNGSQELSLNDKRRLWLEAHNGSSANVEDVAFVPHGRDVVKQLMAGPGFRVTASRYDTTTRSVLVTSRDPGGVQIVVTAVAPTTAEKCDTINSTKSIFSAHKVRQFLKAHHGRQGVGVLAFAVENVDVIQNRYQSLHPNLVTSPIELETGYKVLEVYAFYQCPKNDGNKVLTDRIADPGTILRFMQVASHIDSQHAAVPSTDMLGMTPCVAEFDETSMAAFCDHWVSNVVNRTEFLETLYDTLGFEPKVDFNAGVVAAGEAQIESTVTGNHVTTVSKTKDDALRNQSQVYLPINNALSSVGHVHGFLQEIGQGVQHVASRVENLVDFVQRSNDWREMTGEGFSFLRIPRSYYGMLTLEQLCEGIRGDGSDAVCKECAQTVIACLETSLTITKDGAVDLAVGSNDLHEILSKGLADGPFQEEYAPKRDGVVAVILQSRYRNLYSLLRDNVTEDTYLGLVRNQILVDVQGDDLLFQIFTTNVLQRNPGEEAPFFEFIQRVCSEGSIRPGCGGFGIRNFLTLFLSIEVGKAMNEVVIGKEQGDSERQDYAQRMVDCLTDQLNEANPILNEISDAMTEEGRCQHNIAKCSSQAHSADMAQWEAQMAVATERKKQANARLLECSARYNSAMKNMRESRALYTR